MTATSWADPVVGGDQRLASWVPSSVGAQLRVKRYELGVERFDHGQRDRDLLARARRQRLRGQPREPGGVDQVAALRAAVVVEDGLDSLLPLRALLIERVAQPDLGAKVEDVIGRDPGFRQPAGQQQFPVMAGVSPVVLGALLVAAQRGGLRRFGQVHLRADHAQLLDQKPPAGRRLKRDLERLSAEPLQEPAHPCPIRRRYPRPRDLAGVGVEPLGGDLRSMLVKSHHDRHFVIAPHVQLRAPAAFSPTHRIPWVTVGPSCFE